MAGTWHDWKGASVSLARENVSPVAVLDETDASYQGLDGARGLELARVVTDAATTDLGGGFARFEVDGELAGWTLAYDEVFFVVAGRLEVISEGVSRVAVAGQALLIPKGTTVTYRGTAGTKAFFVLHPRDWMQKMASDGAVGEQPQQQIGGRK
jgi:ethanolamine utilization protein EutQ (cupin superfamily)